MKKFFLVPLVILMVGALIFGGCGGQEPAPAPAPSPAPTPAPTPAETIELTYSYWVPPIPLMARIHNVWAEHVERHTDGRVKVQLIGGAVLGPPADHLEICLSGRADITWIAIGHFPGVFPYSDVRFLPFLFPSGAVGGRIFWEMTEQYLLDTEYKDVKVLFTHPTSVFQLISNKQVHTLEDLKGMKIVMDSSVQVEMTEYLGATAVFVPEGEIFTTLERGLVDGRWRDWEGVVTWKEMEVTKYRTGGIDLAANQGMSIMNLDSWDKLPADVKGVIDDMRLGHSIWAGLSFDEMSLSRLTELQEYDRKVGNPDIYWLPKDEKAKWVAAVEPMYDWWVGDMESKGNNQARELLEFVQAKSALFSGALTGEEAR